MDHVSSGNKKTQRLKNGKKIWYGDDNNYDHSSDNNSDNNKSGNNNNDDKCDDNCDINDSNDNNSDDNNSNQESGSQVLDRKLPTWWKKIGASSKFWETHIRKKNQYTFSIQLLNFFSHEKKKTSHIFFFQTLNQN